jgi:hypothetical protein
LTSFALSALLVLANAIDLGNPEAPAYVVLLRGLDDQTKRSFQKRETKSAR